MHLGFAECGRKNMACVRGRKDRLSILDISAEDDALLPIAEESSASPPKQAPEVRKIESSANVPPPFRPVVKKKTSRSSLRKSLAWDKAFLTGEGVLDLDELPIAQRSPKRLPELPKFDFKSEAGSGSGSGSGSAAPLGDRKVEGEATSANDSGDKDEQREDAPAKLTRSQSERFGGGRCKDLGLPPAPTLHKSSSHRAQPDVEKQARMPPIPRQAPAKKVIESAIQKGTKLRLPSNFPRLEEKRSVPNLLAEKTSSSKVSGSRCDLRSSSSSCRIAENSNSSKPTGLKLPSPKLGFFDPGRSMQSSQSSRSGGGALSGLSGHAARIFNPSKSKPHGLPRGSKEATSSSLPSGFFSRSKDASETAPTSPRKGVEEIKSMPLCVNQDLLNAASGQKQEKAKSSFLAFAKKAVQRLSPVQDNSKAEQENRAPPAQSSSWSGGALETEGTEAVSIDAKEGSLVKTAPVQHSPPNKPAPEPSPWSPVKKNAGIGPFDCTKLNARAQNVDWELL